MKLSIVSAVAALLLAQATYAMSADCGAAVEDNSFLGIRTIPLWLHNVPEAKGSGCEDTPTLTILNPGGNANGSAVIVLPGGAYRALIGNSEGREVADWFATRGFRAFILSYRLASHGYLFPIPLLDAQRAVQLVRARAREYHIEPNRIVMIGFSAGGHLAALAATKFVNGNPDAEDPVERVSSRPDYLVIAYGWLGAVSTDTSHLSYCEIFNVMDRCDSLKSVYTPALFVTKDTPPTFIYHTFTDQKVPVDEALQFYEALVRTGVKSEMHIFANGPHGTALGKGDPALERWPELLDNWLRAQGLMTSGKSVASTGY